MSDALEGLRVLQMVRHHGVIWRGVRVARHGAVLILVVFIVGVLLAHEVLRALVFVRAAILRDLSVMPFSAALSWVRGMHTYWYRPMVSLMSPDENS